MPLYVYRVVRAPDARGADETEETFEVRQSIHDAPLTRHPQTGAPVERVLCVPHVGTGQVGDSQVSNAGFTKYVKTSDGTYEKRAGRGPGRVDPRAT